MNAGIVEALQHMLCMVNMGSFTKVCWAAAVKNSSIPPKWLVVRLPGKTLSFGGNNSSVALLRDGLQGAGEVSLIAHRPTLAHAHESKN